MSRILIVEDNKGISEMLETFLLGHGYEVQCAYDGRRASTLLATGEYDLILMDLMLPGKSGEELIRELRAKKNTPVICLSARSELETRLAVLKMGADDYLLKPFELDEVLVRMEVVLRRSAPEKKTGENYTYGELVYEAENNRVTYRGEEISLTAKESRLLELLLQNPTKTFTKANLYESVWEDEYIYEDNTINVHISNLRNKLKKATGSDYVETVWGIGYRLKKTE